MDPLNALGPGVEVVKSVWPFFGRRINYLRKLSGNVITLRRKNDELVARESDIRQEIRRSEAQGQKANNRVRQLLAEVEEVRQRVTAVIASLEHNRRPIYYGWSRFKLAKKVVLVTQDVDRLLQETSAFGSGLVVQQSPPRAQLLPTTTPIGESTVQKNLDAVLKSLQDPKMRRIGVHGMGGSGKTVTMKEINNQLRRKEDFDKIIWVTVSKDWNLQKVQSDIAGQVNLDLSKNVDNEFRAGQLFKRLQGAKRFLLVLDDMWDRIDLQKLGIPEPNVENKCKIVLTTRSLQVCRLMETDDDIKLNLLSKEEAWELFVSKAGEEALIPKVRPLAEKVASECACLPLAIITVGRAMRKTKDIRAWRTALEDLKISEPDIPDMEEEVFNLLRFSYNRLRNDSVRKCFLYAALFQEDSWIPEDRLISYWIGDGLIKEKGDLTRERDECHKILRDLHDANMFQRFYGNIIMHDVLRDLAIRIMGEEGGVMVKAGLELRQAPRINEWNLANKISLIKNKMVVLEDQPTCPNLSILLLWANPLENIVRDSFFDQMPCLQVLDLCYTKVRKLPSSLSNLVNLRALFLQHCYELKEIPSLARLEKLQLLDLTATSIQKIPEGVDRLSNLRSLDLSLTRCLEECTIFKNAHLEELDLAGSKVFYVMDSGKVVECMKELRSLNSLRILSMSLTLDAYLNALMGLQWEQLQNYVIHIHDPTKDHSTLTTLGPKYFQMDSQNISNHGSSFFFPQNTRTLHIKNCEIPRLSEFMSNMRSLKVCILDHCLLSSENDGLLLGEEMGEYTFTRLERLSLVDIKEVTSIWKGVVPHHACFINLKSLNVYCLHQLKYLGFISFVQHLKNIEDIQVTCCSTLEVLVTSDGEDHGFENANSTKTITLLKLHTLTLADLPELHSISTDIVWICDSLRQLTVENCPKLKSLPFSIDSLSNLVKIRGQTQWWDELEWNDPDIKSLLSPRLQDPDLLYARWSVVTDWARVRGEARTRLAGAVARGRL